MDALYDELVDFFDLFGESSKGKIVPIESSLGDYMFYNSETDFGIFVSAKVTTAYRESCSGVVMESQSFNTQNGKISGYSLTCSSIEANAQFSMVCCDLIKESREKLVDDPSIWFDKWKEILGNATVNRPTYQIIGELVILKDLILHGYDAVWDGPNGGVCDIASPKTGKYFEVKSTVVRNNSLVTLSEEFQAKKADYLCFCRFEEDPNGDYSIDSICAGLIEVGYDRKQLESGLRKLGVRDTSVKSKCYHLLELCYCPVDEAFPDITKWFVGGQKPPAIEKISYTINIASLTRLEAVPVITNKDKI